MGCARPNRRARIETIPVSVRWGERQVAPGLTAGRGLKHEVHDVARVRRRQLALELPETITPMTLAEISLAERMRDENTLALSPLGLCPDGQVMELARPLLRPAIAIREGRREQMKRALRRPLVVIEGTVSRRDNTLNVMADQAWPLSVSFDDRHRRQDWQ